MRSFLIYNVEVFLCLAVFYLFYYLGLKKETKHEFVRIYLIVTLLLSFAIPFIQLDLFYSYDISEIVPTITTPEVTVLADGSTVIAEQNGSSVNYWYIIYGFISTLLLITLIREFFKIVMIMV